MNINSPYLSKSIEQVQGEYLNSQSAPKKTPGANAGVSFDQVLSKVATEKDPIRFSKHATARLSTRGIEMSADQMERLNDARAQAATKGIKESLVLIDQLALIVNVRNNMVVTAFEREADENNVFTNIDGAIIA